MILLFVLCLIIIAIIFYIYNGPVTKQSYIANIYFYNVLSIFILFFINSIYNEKINNGLVVIIFLFLAVFSLYMMKHNNIFFSHIFFLALIVSISIILSYQTSFFDKQKIYNSMILTVTIYIVISIVMFNLPDKYINFYAEMSDKLFYLLIGLVIVDILFIIFSGSANMGSYINIFVFWLFIFFLISDTAKIIKKSDIMKYKKHTEINYPYETFTFYIDFVNIFLSSLIE